MIDKKKAGYIEQSSRLNIWFSFFLKKKTLDELWQTNRIFYVFKFVNKGTKEHENEKLEEKGEKSEHNRKKKQEINKSERSNEEEYNGKESHQFKVPLYFMK